MTQSPRRHIGVTITGADDHVDPYELFHLSRFYPFVEWGVLFSEKRRGQARYPSLKWISALEILAGREELRLRSAENMLLSMHLCGAEARLAVARARDFSPGRMWARVQVNGYEPSAADATWRETRGSWRRGPGFTWILQAREERTLGAVLADALDSDSHVLFDPSGGAGKKASWPAVPSDDYPTMRWGFAGGIGPGNVREVVGAILEKNPALEVFWIDMESGVRDVPGDFVDPQRRQSGTFTSDEFNLDKVRAVLEAVAEMRTEMRSVI